MVTTSDVYERVMIALDGMPLSIYHAKKTTSVYIHSSEIGTISIRDHMPKKSALPRLKYNIIIGYQGKREYHYKGRTCLFYSEYEISDCIDDLKKSCDTYRRR
jgi:hypothetical protein